MYRYRPSLIIVFVIAAILTGLVPSAEAGADPFIGEIILFGGNYAPRGWAFCDGREISISSNSALYSILLTTYGGDGITNFCLPDLRGRVPIHCNTGSVLTARALGETGGVEQVSISVNQMPVHSHDATADVKAASANGNQTDPTGRIPAADPREQQYSDQAYNVSMSSSMVSVSNAPAGGSQAHKNMPPFLTLNYIIALQGIYPSRD